MKTVLVLLVMTVLSTMFAGCSMFRGLTIESSQAECEAQLTKSVQQFCEVAKSNIDKIKGAEAALK